MGDKIIIEKIELINDGTLFQIDYYNENKNYHGRMFIDSEKLFSTEVAPVVHAHWIGLHGTFVPLDEFGRPIDLAFCSRCEEFLAGSDDYKKATGWYCPNCGAKMDEVEDE